MLHAKNQGIDRIGRLDRVSLLLVGIDEGDEHLEFVGLGRAGCRPPGSDPANYPRFLYLFNIDVCESTDKRSLVPCQ